VAPEKAPETDFDKRFGLQSHNASGRENRIPYTRVKKIADNAVKDAQKAWQTERDTTYVPKATYSEVEAKVKDYEGRLQQVAQFEKVMVEQPVEFLKQLVQLPQYAAIFNQPQVPRATPPGMAGKPGYAPADPGGDMPLPDQDMGDGSKAYSMDGIKALMEWNAKNVEARVTQQFEKRYGPLENSYNEYQQVQAVLPEVNQQIAEARTWSKFNENEPAIVKALKDNPRWSLERAYQAVVYPQIQADRDKMRAELLKEIKSAPRATSASSTASRPQATPGAPRSLEDIIADSVKGLSNR
jgi:hypothetical protein